MYFERNLFRTNKNKKGEKSLTFEIYDLFSLLPKSLMQFHEFSLTNKYNIKTRLYFISTLVKHIK